GRRKAPLSFSAADLAEQVQQLAPLGRRQARRDALFVPRNAAQRARDQRASGARQPQAVRAPVAARAALEQAALFKLVEHTDHGGAVAFGGFGEAALRNAGIGFDV